MMKNYQVTHMTRDEVDLAVDWAAREGWNPGLHDAQCFYQTDPQGFFAGRLNDRIVAIGSAVVYDNNFAFCGFYIVDKPHRDQGYGIELTRARLNYIGQRNAGIDGVMEMVDKYHLLGYEFAHNNARYSLESFQSKTHLEAPKPQSDQHHQITIQNPLIRPAGHLLPKPGEKGNKEGSYLEELIVPINSIDFESLCAYDRAHFPAARPSFLSCWTEQKQSRAVAYVLNNQIQGYGVIRTCRNGFKVGPLFADTPAIANSLFTHLIQYAKGKVVFLDIPENNPFAIELTKYFKMTKVFATARMYLKEQPKLKTEGIYGITSFELG